MRYLFFALLMTFAGTSCVTNKKCHRKFPSQNDTIRIVSTRDSIVIKDTTIFIHLPGDTVYNQVEIPCPPPPPDYVPKKVCAETSLAIACAWWSYPVIKLELIAKDTTIEKRLAGALRDAYFWKTEFQKITVTSQPVKFIPGFYRACTFLFMGVVLAGLGYVVFRFLK